MQPTQLLFVGGFLGAGKTTLLKQAAHHLAKQGKRVGLITNDQAEHLVDTAMLRQAGFGVEEVAGGCFCCRFDDLVSSSERLVREQDPDVILGEPVGSCTDVAATVLAPLRALHGDRFHLAPYSVLVEPSRLRQSLGIGTQSLFSEDVRYIFDKQLEEANLLIVSKADQLAPGEMEHFRMLLSERYPGLEVMALSAMSGAGIQEWLERLEARNAATEGGPRVLEAIDYDRYAKGEAELGWLNLTARLEDVPAITPDSFALQVLERFRVEARRHGTDVAHVKLTLTDGSRALYANLISIERSAQLTGEAPPSLEGSTVILNARLPLAPEDLEPLAMDALRRAVGETGVLSVEEFQCLRPARPAPTHRFSA